MNKPLTRARRRAVLQLIDAGLTLERATEAAERRRAVLQFISAGLKLEVTK